MKFTIKINDIEKTKSLLLDEINKYKTDNFVTVGVHDDKNERPDPKSPNNATIGYLLQFGVESKNIPPRPWLDTGVESGANDYNTALKGSNLNDAIENIGKIAEAHVKQYMNDLKSPPNAQRTIKNKGFDDPLIHHGILRDSVGYKVIPYKKQEGL